MPAVWLGLQGRNSNWATDQPSLAGTEEFRAQAARYDISIHPNVREVVALNVYHPKLNLRGGNGLIRDAVLV